MAIAAVIGAGVAMFVAYLSHVRARSSARRRGYYERYRFADVFAAARSGRRSALGADIAAIPGVPRSRRASSSTSRSTSPGLDEPATGRLVSIPVPERPMLNALFLRSGRLPEPGRADEVVVSEAFAGATSLAPGDTARRGRSTAAAAACASSASRSRPNTSIAIRPGDVMPDNRPLRRAVDGPRAPWPPPSTWRAAFNDVGARAGARRSGRRGHRARSTACSRPTAASARIAARLQMSHWRSRNELEQLPSMGLAIPVDLPRRRRVPAQHRC